MSGTENILSRIAKLEQIEVAEHVHRSLIFLKTGEIRGYFRNRRQRPARMKKDISPFKNTIKGQL